ncbi:MAG: metallophosphoesterase [Magnetococcus sp. YQC-3]
MKWVGFCLLLLLLPLCLVMVLNEANHLEVTHHPIAGTPGTAPRLRIAQISDLHLVGGAAVEEAVVREVNAAPPDLLVLTGDMVDRRERLSALDAFLGQLETFSDKWAVLGNHEYWSGLNLQALRRIYAKHRVNLLVNEATLLNRAQGQLLLVGLDDARGGRPDWNKAIRAHAAWRGAILVLAHNPNTAGNYGMPARPPGNGLILSGHTHGGQIVLFGMAVDMDARNAQGVAGWQQVGGWRLYISRGVGTSIIPVRLGARPELALFEWDYQTNPTQPLNIGQ